MTICKNCGSTFEGNYCSNCSQHRLANNRLNLKDVIEEFLDTLFNFDRGLIYTFGNLLIRPALVALNFIEGRRKRFTSPVKYFVISTIIQALAIYLISNQATDIPGIEFPFVSDETNRIVEYWGQNLTFNFPILLGIFTTIVWTFLVYVLFAPSHYNFTEIMVSSLYFYGTIFILINLLTLIYQPFTQENLPMDWVSALGFVYIMFAYMQFFKNTPILWRIVKIVLVFILLFFFRLLLLPLFISWFTSMP